VLTGSGRLGFLTTLTLAAALSVAGCSAGSSVKPQALPPLSASATPKPTSSPIPPPSTPKPTAKAAELAAATAVVRHYYAIANNLRHDMDSSALAALFTPECVCQAQVDAVRSSRAKGEHYIDQAHLNSVVTNSEGPDRADVLVDLTASRGGLVKADGTQVTHGRPRNHVKRLFLLQLAHAGWLIYEIENA
jgi:hypothetical protein